MKKLSIIFSIFVLFLSSCVPSREEIIDELIRTEVCNGLVNPASYDPIDTKIDSAFTPSDDLEIYDRIEQFMSDAEELAQEQVTIDSVETVLSMIKGYMGLLNPGDIWGIEKSAEYKELKSKCSETLKTLKGDYEEALQSARKDFNELSQQLDSTDAFIGYEAIHRYRAENPDGRMQLDTIHFFIDKDLTSIVRSIKDAEYKRLQAVKESFEETFLKQKKR